MIRAHTHRSHGSWDLSDASKPSTPHPTKPMTPPLLLPIKKDSARHSHAGQQNTGKGMQGAEREGAGSANHDTRHTHTHTRRRAPAPPPPPAPPAAPSATPPPPPHAESDAPPDSPAPAMSRHTHQAPIAGHATAESWLAAGMTGLPWAPCHRGWPHQGWAKMDSRHGSAAAHTPRQAHV